MAERVRPLRPITPPFVVAQPQGVSIRTRLKGLTSRDEEVLRRVGAHLGSLAGRDLAHTSQRWAERKRNLTGQSSSRWAGAITKATHDQWALSRRSQAAHLTDLDAAIDTIEHRLALPLGEKGSKRAPGGYRSRSEWFAKSRRLAVLKARREKVAADFAAGRVHVVRGGRALARVRHHLQEADLTAEQWRKRWQAARWFLSADGESGKRYGNETLRITPDGQVSLKLPAPLTGLANAPHGRYVLAAKVSFAHRGREWADRVAADRATAYRIHLDPERGRWYVDASWQRPPVRLLPLEAARAAGVVAVDTNADHLAAWRLDVHGNPTGRLKTRLVSMAAECGIAVVAVDPAYTSVWGARYWQQSTSTPARKTTRHEAASLVIGRRALGHGARRRTAPPPHHRSDGAGHRTVQAERRVPGREGTRPARTDTRTRSGCPPGV